MFAKENFRKETDLLNESGHSHLCGESHLFCSLACASLACAESVEAATAREQAATTEIRQETSSLVSFYFPGIFSKPKSVTSQRMQRSQAWYQEIST